MIMTVGLEIDGPMYSDELCACVLGSAFSSNHRHS